ncbi:probable chemoreceptor glutamine deamidase CheD 2 [Candidatus Moduliflexus flocculans]|uniref:Probable chemoreceptor glutamine deamidase CheD n=1 Tax=Candidatus Moduliflexus flocculans TaxID=1499966 RepID=A0A0S6VVM2_9BACT|nr:probable chemoreceptor glutamine deamidase CheD 2 [Candidatus Moduliflexus flocculans]
MTNRAKEYQYVCLYPGEIYIAETPAIIWTVLGSCLAIVFHHHASGCGAICHAQLSELGLGTSQCSEACPNPCFATVSGENPFKFVSCSIRYVVEYFAKKGIYPSDLDVKLFGGANILVASPLKTVGEMNIEVAERLLDDYQLRVVSKHIGGNNGRTLYFYSDTGEVFLKRHSTKSVR